MSAERVRPSTFWPAWNHRKESADLSTSLSGEWPHYLPGAPTPPSVESALGPRADPTRPEAAQVSNWSRVRTGIG